MEWLVRQAREGLNARTYVLVGVLAVVLLGIYGMDERTRTLRSRSAVAGAAGGSVAAAAAPARSMPAAPTPPGWGPDPFQRPFQP